MIPTAAHIVAPVCVRDDHVHAGLRANLNDGKLLYWVVHAIEVHVQVDATKVPVHVPDDVRVVSYR